MTTKKQHTNDLFDGLVLDQRTLELAHDLLLVAPLHQLELHQTPREEHVSTIGSPHHCERVLLVQPAQRILFSAHTTQ